MRGTPSERREPQTALSPSPANQPKYKRLTATDRAFALRYAKQGLTQREIAQRLGCTQGTISQWLSQCDDTTAESSQYLRGQALPMAEKIVKKGRASDLVKCLQGVGVLQEERTPGVTIQIGIKDSDVSIATISSTCAVSSLPSSTGVTPQVLDVQAADETGSDNGDYGSHGV